MLFMKPCKRPEFDKRLTIKIFNFEELVWPGWIMQVVCPINKCVVSHNGAADQVDVSNTQYFFTHRTTQELPRR
jgi:hypothetical protein